MRVIRTIIFILVCLGLIWLIVLLLAKIFSTTPNTSVPTSNLSIYAETNGVATLTIDGPVIINQDHRSIRVSVDASQSMIQLIGGYDGGVIRQDTFPNTKESFVVFLRSLDTLGFAKGVKTASQDERGQCPLQNRYVYQLTDGSKEVVHFWSTSCGTGTFNGLRESVRSLFQRQIPVRTYSTYSSDLSNN